MGSGAALGASGSQKTTREAPKTIFASKMGGPGLQKGFFVSVWHHFKLKMGSFCGHFGSKNHPATKSAVAHGGARGVTPIGTSKE